MSVPLNVCILSELHGRKASGDNGGRRRLRACLRHDPRIELRDIAFLDGWSYNFKTGYEDARPKTLLVSMALVTQTQQIHVCITLQNARSGPKVDGK